MTRNYSGFRSRFTELTVSRKSEPIAVFLRTLLADDFVFITVVSGHYQDVFCPAHGEILDRLSTSKAVPFLIHLQVEDDFYVFNLIPAGEETLGLLEDMLRKVLERERISTEEAELEGIIRLARFFVSGPCFESNLTVHAEVAAIKCALAWAQVPLRSRVFGLDRKVLECSGLDRRHLLNRYVARLLELGTRMSDIREYFLECLDNPDVTRNLDSVLELTGAKCFEHGSESRDEDLAAVLPRYFEHFWVELTLYPMDHGKNLRAFAWLCSLGMYDAQQHLSMVRDTLIQMISYGGFAQAWELIYELGISDVLGLFMACEHEEMDLRVATERVHVRDADNVMKSFAPEAFALAREQKRMRAAAAIAILFGARNCLPIEDQFTDDDISRIEASGNIPRAQMLRNSLAAVKLVVQSAVKDGIPMPISYQPVYGSR